MNSDQGKHGSVATTLIDSYDVFYLTRAPGVKLPGGRAVFPGVPAQTPERIMSDHGLRLAETQTLDAAKNLIVASWRR